MSLKDRLNIAHNVPSQTQAAETASLASSAVNDFVKLKEQLHGLLVEKVNSTPT